MALNEKWIPVFENEELAMKVIPLQPEEAQKVLAENGYEFTLDEIIAAGEELYQMRERMNTSGELTEDDLSDVAGGGWLAGVKFACQAAGRAMQIW